MTDYYVDPGSSTAADWQASYNYSVGDRVWPTAHASAAAGYVYECTTDTGSSGGTEPTWVYTTPDTSTTTDGGITWTCRNPDSWAEALPSLQGAFDRIAAGETCYCRGTEQPSVSLDVDQSNEGTDQNPISIVGCNASGNEDGTCYEVDATSVTGSAILDNVAGSGDYWVWRNIRVHGASSHGWNVGNNGNTGYNKWVNCESDNNSGSGWAVYYGPGFSWIFCSAHDNGVDGFGLNWQSDSHYFCESYNNSEDGYGGHTNGASLYVGCTACDNLDGLGQMLVANVLLCTIDGNSSNGIEGFTASRGYSNTILFNRITNNTTYGIENNTTNTRVWYGWNFFEGNGTDIENSMDPLIDTETKVNSNIFTGTIGYVSPDSPNWNYALTTSAAFRNQAIPIGGLNGKTTSYFSAGCVSVEDLGGGGSVAILSRPNSLLRR
jgi:hypothetical protein